MCQVDYVNGQTIKKWKKIEYHFEYPFILIQWWKKIQFLNLEHNHMFSTNQKLGFATLIFIKHGFLCFIKCRDSLDLNCSLIRYTMTQ